MKIKMVNVVHSGNMLGQLGLLYNRLRAATCIGITPLEVGYMGKEDFDRCFSSIQIMAEKTKTSFFEKYILRDEKLNFLSKKLGIMFNKKKYPCGEVFQYQKKLITTFYIIFSGSVVLSRLVRQQEEMLPGMPIRRDKDIFHYREILAGKRGFLVGEDGLMDHKLSSYMCKATSNVEVYEISLKKLRDVCKEN